jgi:hypothetical protein
MLLQKVVARSRGEASGGCVEAIILTGCATKYGYLACVMTKLLLSIWSFDCILCF